jgi:predicted Zn-dependent protease
MELWSNLAEAEAEAEAEAAAAEAEAFSFFRKGALSLPTETLRVARICNDLLSIVKNLSIIQNCSYQMFGICLKNL